LSSPGKPNIRRSQRHFDLHYFPDIPIDGLANGHHPVAKEKQFKRSCFENLDPECLKTSSHAADPATIGDKDARTIAEIEEKYYQRGFAAGEKAGFQSRTQEVETVLRSLQQALSQLQGLHKEIYHAVEKEIVDLALAVARKVVCQEVKTNKEVVLEIVQAALSRVEVPGEITIKLNPADLQFIRETNIQLTDFFPHLDHVKFEAEASISNGGCIIETNLGEIDARIEKQFQVVEETFRNEFKKAELSR
jgi:flagellar biosynthesis/type III secretory pathway protein FliH